MKTNSIPQRKNHRSMSDHELEQKIISKYNKINPQPLNMKEKVDVALNKLNK